MKNEKKIISKDGNPMNTKGINEAKQDKTEGGISDGASLEVVASELCKCANSWEPKARILGNVRAEDIVRLCKSFSLHSQRESGESKPLGEGERVFRKVSVKERLPEKGKKVCTIIEDNGFGEFPVGNFLLDNGKGKLVWDNYNASVLYWLEEVPTDAVSREEFTDEDIQVEIESHFRKQGYRVGDDKKVFDYAEEGAKLIRDKILSKK